MERLTGQVAVDRLFNARPDIQLLEMLETPPLSS
jgi:hypothetical protein